MTKHNVLFCVSLAIKKITCTDDCICRDPFLQSLEGVSNNLDKSIEVARVKVQDESVRRFALFARLSQFSSFVNLQLTC